jgi:hypothetical protein
MSANLRSLTLLLHQINCYKKTLIIAVALFLAWPAFSQSGVRFGIKAGGNLSFAKIEIQNVSVKGDARPGFLQAV